MDVLALAGEILSILGITAGLPLVAVPWLLRRSDGTWRATEVAVVQRADGLTARWYVDATFFERRLRHGERDQWPEGWHTGFVSEHHPSRLRVEHGRPGMRAVGGVGVVCLVAGGVGLILSVIPMLL